MFNKTDFKVLRIRILEFGSVNGFIRKAEKNPNYLNRSALKPQKYNNIKEGLSKSRQKYKRVELCGL